MQVRNEYNVRNLHSMLCSSVTSERSRRMFLTERRYETVETTSDVQLLGWIMELSTLKIKNKQPK